VIKQIERGFNDLSDDESTPMGDIKDDDGPGGSPKSGPSGEFEGGEPAAGDFNPQDEADDGA
jgi:hypothetical protein